jgi:serine phosphatase RsbU (regulator of sigma subunit)
MTSEDWLQQIPLRPDESEPDESGSAESKPDNSDQELESLAVAFHREELPAGTLLFRQGEPGDFFAMLLRGEVEIIHDLGTPEERLLVTIQPGEFLGEMSLIDPGGLRSASGRARGAVEWAKISQAEFTALLERQPRLALRLLQETIRRLRRSEADTIRDLREKNQALAKAYDDLQQAQSALIEKGKLEHELEIARVIQKSILPETIPEVQGWQIATYWQPARAVSGDFFDIIAYPDGRMSFLIADVSGKGVPAALVMATTCSVLRAIANADLSPGALLEQVNLLLCPYMPRNMFVTCLCGTLDTASGILRFANAGHNLPIKITPGGAQELRATGMPLGLLPGMTYQENETHIRPGDGLLMYTDGMVEAHNDQQEMFGLPRLHDHLDHVPCDPQVIDYLVKSLAEFTGPNWEQEDDVTFMVIARSQAG